jgi:tetratricopeptide (TPR) repeat protein
MMNSQSTGWSNVLMSNKKKNKRKKLSSSRSKSGFSGKHAPAGKYNAAIAYYQKGQLLKALAVLGDMPATGRPNDKGAFYHLRASILFKLGNIKEAAAAARQAVALSPKNAEFLNTLGVILDRVGRPMDGLNYLSKASSLEPGRMQTFKNMGAILWKMERHDQALICYRKALELDENNLELLKTIGYNYYLLGDLKEAADYYEKALTKKGDHSEVWSGIGALLQSKGDREGARLCYKKALETNPRCFPAYEIYTHLGNIPDDEKRVRAATLERFLETDDLSVRDRRRINFSLARLSHDLKEYDRAFQYYLLANDFRRKDLDSHFTIELYEKEIETLISNITESSYKKRRKGSSSSRQPVFVVGMPRSGTTLLEQIIASHSQGFGAGELPTIKKIVTDWRGFIQQKPFTYTIDELSPIQTQAKYYLSRLRKHAQSAARIVDKMPHNLQFLWCIGLLFPEAPVIYCRRDPRDTCFSCFVTDFNSGHEYKNDLYTLGRYYRIYEKLMAHWKQVIPNPILTVQYEELVDNPEQISRPVIEHIGLDWEPECLGLRSKQHFSLTASNVQIRKGIYRSSVQRWKLYEKHLAPLLDGLGDYKN